MNPVRLAAGVRQGAFELEVDLTAHPGEIVAVLGPNGAGKSTLLRAVAGLRPVDSGTVDVGGRRVDDPARGVFVPPEERRVGVVFQDHRLFPHLRVLDNVAFGLRARGADRGSARAAAADWLERLGLTDLLRRRPSELSGGQAQRVALARALAGSPDALLLDEPMAALDVATRAQVQAELRRHLRDYSGATLLVTHDPIEALLLAGRIVVLEGGRVVQQGTPGEVTTRPATDYVARLVGVNLYTGVVEAGPDRPFVRLDDGGTVGVATIDAPVGRRVLVAVRPSALSVHLEAPQVSARNVWPGSITELASLADRIRLTVRGDRTALVDVTPAAVAELDLTPGRTVWLSAKATDLSAYPQP